MHMNRHGYERRSMTAPAVALILLLLTVLLAMPVAMADNGGGQPPQMDISITDIGLSDPEPVQDDEVTVTATVVSNMTGPIHNVTVVFSVNRQVVGNVSGLTLMPGTPLEASINWTASTGINLVTAKVVVQGMPLDDSTASIEVYVEPKPVGDVSTLLYALLAIAIVVLGMAMGPSILSRLMP